MQKKPDTIVIVDFGGQYAHLIASRIRRMGVFAEIFPPEKANINELSQEYIKGIILSGGPQSVYGQDSPKCDITLFKIGKPVLGICYGHQYLAQSLGGNVKAGHIKEYGKAKVTHMGICPLFDGIPPESIFWMSHGDEVATLPKGFKGVANTQNCHNAAMWNPETNIYGIQFHPEVTHSEFGTQILKNFVDITAAKHSWTMQDYLKSHSDVLKQQIGKKNVFLFASGGVDSSVCLAWLSEILGKGRVKGLFVDTGLMRQNEGDQVEQFLKDFGADLVRLNAKDQFLDALKGIYDPETKRNIIGNTFLDVQRQYFAENKLNEGWILAQGTIYPDTIETGATAHASKIKTHHNRVPEIEEMIKKGLIIEPIAELYKDEVRELGQLVGLPKEMIERHPFPGPGLGVRMLCNENPEEKTILTPNQEYILLPLKSVGVQGDARTYRHPFLLQKWETITQATEKATKILNTDQKGNRVVINLKKDQRINNVTLHKAETSENRVRILQKADAIVTQLLKKHDLYNKVWQFPVVLAPLSFNNDTSTSETIILRPVDSIDAMSATPAILSNKFFTECTTEILKIKEVSAVLLDVTSKPPGTIEWE